MVGTGIHICGLNGAGKSTLGKILAERIGFLFIDIENLYFIKINPDNPYTTSRSREEIEQLLIMKINKHPDFVFAACRSFSILYFRLYY